MSPNTAPIRVGILGLGIGDPAVPLGLWAAVAHLPYLQSSPAYRVTAICNSSVKSAQASIDHYNLGSDVKPYGNPSDIAADPNIDLIVISVRVEKHFALAKPALLAGKDVFVEWPLAANISQAEELTTLAKEKGVKTFVGVQSRASPLTIKLRSLLKNNEIGTILSSIVTATFSSGIPNSTLPAGAEYYVDMNSGGNHFTIYFGHFLDNFIHVLGPFSEKMSAVLNTKYPIMKIVDLKTGNVVNEIERTTPDHIFVQGILTSGALASITYRTVPTEQIQESGLVWTITGSEGEIVVEVPKGEQMGQWQTLEPSSLVVKIRKGKGEVQTVDLVPKEERKEVRAVIGGGLSGGNVARHYEAFLKGEGENYATVESALESQRLLERIQKVAGK